MNPFNLDITFNQPFPVTSLQNMQSLLYILISSLPVFHAWNNPIRTKWLFSYLWALCQRNCTGQSRPMFSQASSLVQPAVTTLPGRSDSVSLFPFPFPFPPRTCAPSISHNRKPFELRSLTVWPPFSASSRPFFIELSTPLVAHASAASKESIGRTTWDSRLDFV